MRMLGELLAKSEQTREALNDALEYLEACNVFVPDFRHRIDRRWGGSYVDCSGRRRFMRLGCYPTRSWADWIAMHELVHVLVDAYQPVRRREFKRVFGKPEPDDYHDQQWKVVSPRAMRPSGYPSYYGRDGGGEEHFAELVAFMYTAPRVFASAPPRDLRRSWCVAWTFGLSRMTEHELR
jgi:hypothetical protein